MLHIMSQGRTDVGRVRKHNEDSFDLDDRMQLYVVADGMGGHIHGEVASRIAVEAVHEFILESSGRDGTLPIGYDPGLLHHSNRLKRSVHTAHEQLLSAIREDETLFGMGTTVVSALVDENVLTLAHVGDSRAYRLRGEYLEQLTQDHTWVNEQVLAGYLSEEQARIHPLKNVVTRALGSESAIVVDVLETDVRLGDLVLLCSDGLTAMLSDAEIRERLVAEDPLAERCRGLIEEANARGGVDNVTVVLLEVAELDVETPTEPALPLLTRGNPP